MQRVSSYEYKNGYLYLVVREAPEHGPNAFLLCCGIDILKFRPFARSVHGICSNPAYRGLQLMRADITAFATSKGAVPKKTGFAECMFVSPPGEGWYRDSMLLTGATPKVAREVMAFGVRDLLKKVLTVCAPTEPLPKELPNPPALEKQIDSLVRKRKAGR